MDKFFVVGKQRAIPAAISAIPLQSTKLLGAGKYGGIIRRYARGNTKCMQPAKTYMPAIRYRCQGYIITP